VFDDPKQFMSAIAQLSEEKGISEEKIYETIEAAIAAAYKKDYAERGENIRAKFNSSTGEVEIFKVQTVVDEDSLVNDDGEPREINDKRELTLKEAKKTEKKAKVEDEILFKLEPKEDFGRIAAQTAKQVIIQRVREAERESIWDDYNDKEGDILAGFVQRVEGENVFVDLGRASGILFPSEQIPGEHYRTGQRLKVYVLEVRQEVRGDEAAIVISRSHPDMLKKLFELEVPEIASGVVEIKSIAREAGSRSKIAVTSNEGGIDPIGSCVGQKGTRIQTVINEINGEMIDVVLWSSDTKEFIENSLSPAKVDKVEIKKARKEAVVTVPEDQLSLAIGKRGQNVRLAAKLTGWKIDIKDAGGEEASDDSDAIIKKEDDE
jgi:N utilization substance protein A